jgi:hypothetical protein
LSLVARLLALSVATYAVVAATRHAWLAAAAAVIVAALLWRRHPRARFAAYIFLSVLLVRGVATGGWVLAAYAVIALAVMQTAAAREAWPRLVPGRWGGRGDRMRRS